jgi:thiol:disulfide interchange protein DsbD
MIGRTVMLIAIFAGHSFGSEAPVPGRAVADWIAVSSTASPGQPLQTAIRIRHDKGWHSYWINPGEAGMPTTVEWKLPPGWQHGELRFPSPVRFQTGGLVGYGYEGTLLLPVAVTPPAGFTGTAMLRARISWLACGDHGCVPGSAELTLELAAGDTSPGPAAAQITDAIKRLPQPAGESLRLVVTESKKSLTLALMPADSSVVDFSRHEVFPFPPDIVDPKAGIRFTARDGRWTASVAMSEFAVSPVKSLDLVLDDRKNPPLSIGWKID